MRRRLAEQPRLVVAQALIVVAVVAGSVYAGAQLAGDGDDEAPAKAAELDRTRAALRLQRRNTRAARRDGDRLKTRIRVQRRRTATLRRRTRALKRSLDRTQRPPAGRRARRRGAAPPSR